MALILLARHTTIRAVVAVVAMGAVGAVTALFVLFGEAAALIPTMQVTLEVINGPCNPNS
jgi:hypothetical protein